MAALPEPNAGVATGAVGGSGPAVLHLDPLAVRAIVMVVVDVSLLGRIFRCCRVIGGALGHGWSSLTSTGQPGQRIHFDPWVCHQSEIPRSKFQTPFPGPLLTHLLCASFQGISYSNHTKGGIGRNDVGQRSRVRPNILVGDVVPDRKDDLILTGRRTLDKAS